MSDNLREILETPFPESVISEVRKGSQTLSYIPVAYMVQRANTAWGPLGWGYTTEVVDRYTYEYNKKPDVVWLMVKVSVFVFDEDNRKIIKEAFGGARIYAKGDVSDSYKAAVSVGLKKALQMFGIGLYLAMDEDPELGEEEDDSIPASWFDRLVELAEGLDDDSRFEFLTWYSSEYDGIPFERNSITRGMCEAIVAELKAFADSEELVEADA